MGGIFIYVRAAATNVIYHVRWKLHRSERAETKNNKKKIWKNGVRRWCVLCLCIWTGARIPEIHQQQFNINEFESCQASQRNERREKSIHDEKCHRQQFIKLEKLILSLCGWVCNWKRKKNYCINFAFR